MAQHDEHGASDGADAPDGADASGPARRPRRLPVWQESILLLVMALALALVVKTFFVQAFYIPSGSMEPGLVLNDRILVQKVSYWGGGDPERGDVVVFEDPGDWLGPQEDVGPGNTLTSVMSRIGLYPTGGHLVKRVIGVAGDVIVCCDDDGRLTINGVPLDSSDFTRNRADCDGPMVNQCRSDWEVGPVPEGSVFVMGDHRDDSADSSFHICRNPDTGCEEGDEYVPTDLVVGKVLARVWPADRFSVLHRPEAFDALDQALQD